MGDRRLNGMISTTAILFLIGVAMFLLPQIILAQSLYSWGDNTMGQLGIGKEGISLVPVQTLDLSDVVAIASGDYHSLAIKSDGTAWSWGNNYNG